MSVEGFLRPRDRESTGGLKCPGNLSGSVRSARLPRRYIPRRPRAVEAVSNRVADPLRALQIPSAENAAHGHGVNKVRVGRALAVRTSLGHHVVPPC